MESQNIANIQKKKLHKELIYQSMARKSNFTSNFFFLYSPQRDKALNTSKKKNRNNGMGS
jgi:hypothetical protein